MENKYRNWQRDYQRKRNFRINTLKQLKQKINTIIINSLHMKSFFNYLLIGCIGFQFLTETVNAQSCINDNDLREISGSLLDHTKTPMGGGYLPAAEKKIAWNVLTAVENICKKNFVIKGGEAKGVFADNEKEYFELFYHSAYQYQIGFYQHLCVNNKKITSDEYGADFTIKANAAFKETIHSPERYGAGFYANNSKNDPPYISLFRFIKLSQASAVIINAGNGYIDNHQGNEYADHTDVYRNWYITPPGTKLLTVVNRKEFLESLLEFYDREKIIFSGENERKLTEAKKYMLVYEKNGNTAMYQSHAENKRKAEQEIAKTTAVYKSKKEKVELLLKNNAAAWLNEIAVIDPKVNYCDNTFSDIQPQCFNFTGFYNSPDGLAIYKWNSTVVKQYLANPAKPLFFKVSFRYKAGEKFSKGIQDGFVKNFDFEALRKLL